MVGWMDERRQHLPDRIEIRQVNGDDGAKESCVLPPQKTYCDDGQKDTKANDYCRPSSGY
jgi:hypothetical protein